MTSAVIPFVMLATTMDAGVVQRPVRPVCPGERQATNLLVFHAYGEGSHALSDALDNLGCVHFIRNEVFKAQVDVLHAFFTSPLETWRQATMRAAIAGNMTEQRHLRELAAALDAFMEAETKQGCHCSSRGALVRLDVLDGKPKGGSWTTAEVRRGIGDLCPLFAPTDGSPPVLPVILVRTDLMRWSLSAYGRLTEAVDNNPQFDNKEIVAMNYDLDLLDSGANKNVMVWRFKAVILNALRAVCGVRPAVHVYEAFDMRQGLPEGMANYLLPCYDGTADQLPVDASLETVRQAHTYNINEFVSNAEAVVGLFAMSSFMTFGETLAEQGLSMADIADLSEPNKMSQTCSARGGELGHAGG
jgi:hypothetical protein